MLLRQRDRRLLGLLCVAACLLACATAPPPRPPYASWAAVAPRPAPPTPLPATLVHHTLANGLRVSILPDPHSPMVATQVFYHVGSAHEDAASAGFAHLFEHLMFGDTASYDKRDLDDLIHRHGGSVNAYTAADETVYVSLLPAAQHARLLELEAARMTQLVLDEPRLQRERRIIVEEQRLRYENSSESRVFVKALRALLREHPYNRIGMDATISTITLDGVRRFYARYYRPGNAHLVIVGPVDAAQTLAQVQRTFGAIPAGSGAPAPEPPLLSDWRFPGELTLSQDALPGKAAALLYPLPAQDHPDTWALQVLTEILAGGRHSPLFEDLVRQRRVAVAAGAQVVQRRRGGLLLLYAGYLPYRRKASALRYLEEARDRLGRLEWLTEARLASAKRALRKAQLAARLSASAQARLLGEALHRHGDLRAAFDHSARIDAVTLEEVRGAFARHVLLRAPSRVYLTPERVPAWVRLFGWLYPLLLPAAPPQAALPPSPPPLPPAPRPPGSQRGPLRTWAVDAATTAVLAFDPRVPVVHLRVELPAGRWSPWLQQHHGEDALRVLFRDAAGLLSRRADALAADLSAGAEDEHSVIALTCLREDLPAVLALLRDALQGRDFDRGLLRGMNLSRGAVFSAQQKRPEFRLQQEVLRRLHGRDDPRRRFVEEPPSIETRPARLSAARDALLRLPGRVIGIAGDITQEEVAPLLRDLLPPAGPPPAGLAPLLAPLRPVPGERRARLRPLNQAHLALVRPSLGLRHPDYAAFLIADHVLGGHMRSRLYEALRHESGQSYVASSLELEDVVPGAYLLQTQTRADNRGQAEQTLRRVLAELQRGGLTEPERQAAASSLLGALVRRQSTATQRLAHALFERRHGLPAGFMETLTQRAAALPLATINAFVRDFYDPAHFALVAVSPE